MDTDNDGDDDMLDNGDSFLAASTAPEEAPKAAPVDIDTVYMPDHVQVLSDSGATSADFAPLQSTGDLDRAYAAQRIDEVFTSFGRALVTDSVLSLTLHRRPRGFENQTQASQRLDFHEPEPDPVQITFPGRTSTEAWKFTVFVRLLDIVRGALAQNRAVSKRDIYYQDPALFGRQAVVDRYIDDLAFTFRVPRNVLNVSAAAKGLVVGRLRVIRAREDDFQVAHSGEGTLIPELIDEDVVCVGDLQWILVVEKEAVFHSLCASTFWRSAIHRGLMVTGKGYPDVATRKLLHMLASAQPRLSLAALTDFDPDGVAIFSVYKHGSASLTHLNDRLSVPGLQRVGITADQLTSLPALNGQSLVELTPRDRRRAMRMLGWPHLQNSEEKRELQVMLMLNVKAEIEALTEQAEEWNAFVQHHIGTLHR